MLTIRLMRFGRKHQPFFRLVVVPKRGKPARSTYVEMVGWVNPTKKEQHVDADRVRYWIEQGAQPSDTAWNLFVREGIVEGAKRKKGRTTSRGGPSPSGGTVPPAQKKEEPAAGEAPPASEAVAAGAPQGEQKVETQDKALVEEPKSEEAEVEDEAAAGVAAEKVALAEEDEADAAKGEHSRTAEKRGTMDSEEEK